MPIPATAATREVKPLLAGSVSVLVAGLKTGDVYYMKCAAGPRNSVGAIVYANNVDSGATREAVKLPPARNGSSLNADRSAVGRNRPN